MNSLLECALTGFTNIRTEVRRGITHTAVRVQGIGKRSFTADIYINRRTQEVSISRIDTADIKLLHTILAVIGNFSF